MRISKLVLPIIIAALFIGGVTITTDVRSADAPAAQSAAVGAQDHAGAHGQHEAKAQDPHAQHAGKGAGAGKSTMDCPGMAQMGNHSGGHGGTHSGGQGAGRGKSKMDCPGMAQMGNHSGGHGDGQTAAPSKAMNISPEQRAKVNTIVQEAQAVIQPLRDQLFVKHEELRAMQQASNPDVTAVSKKAQEIIALREQLRKERHALGQKIDKELGLPEGTHTLGGHTGKQTGTAHGQHSGSGAAGDCN